MSNSEREQTRAQNEALRGDIDALLETFERQRQGLAEAQAQLAATRVEAWSSDNLVHVESTVAGVPTAIRLEPDAFKRSTPEKLGNSITEAVQAAARRASEASMQAVGPMRELAGTVPDLPDLVPGAPSIRSVVDSLFPATEPAAAQPSPEPMDAEAEDEYFRNRSYLEGGR